MSNLLTTKIQVKNIFLILIIFCSLVGCKNQEPNQGKIVTDYYKAFDSGDYKKIKSLIDDSVTIVAGDFVTPFDKESYYEQFRWDSIFQPSYEIVEINKLDDQIIATVSVSSLRFQFLKNNPLICSHEISFNDDKISRLKEIEFIDADWNVWQQERDSLVSWIKINHPELDGFINDLSMQGAINYLQAIDLYQSNGENF